MNKASASKILQTAAGYILAAVFLVWVFHDVDWKILGRHMASINIWWVALAIVFDTLGYAAAGYRWHLLLKPLGDIGTLRATQGIYAGLFINEILPLRVGEVARAYLVSVWMPLPFVSVIPSLALERLFEGIWLAAGIGITAISVPLPRDLLLAGDVFGVVILALCGIVLFLMLRKKDQGRGGEKRRTVRWGPVVRLVGIIGRLEGGFRSIGLSPLLLGGFLATLAKFVLQAFAFWFVMTSYGIRQSFWVAAAVFLIIHFGTALPNAPASVGSYQFFCVVGLTIFGISKTAAAGFSIVVFLLLSLPLWALGSLALARSGMSLPAIKDKIRNARIRRDSPEFPGT